MEFKGKKKGWDLIFGVACWFLWRWRNCCLFEEGFLLPENGGAVVKAYVREIISARVEFGRLTGRKELKQISWAKPSVGWFNLTLMVLLEGIKSMQAVGG